MIDKLQRLGLTDGEAKVYLALLQSEGSTVGPIVKVSGVAYSNIYEILERLQEKGLVSFIIHSKTRNYHAVPPHRINDYLQMKETSLSEQKKLLQKILPDLEQQHTAERTNAEVFVGWNGMRSAYQELIRNTYNREQLFLYVPNPEIDKKVDEFFFQFDHYQKKQKIRMRGISHKKYAGSKYQKQAEHIQIKYLNIPVANNIDICGNKLLLTSWKEKPTAVLISSAEMAKNFRAYFEDLWRKAK